MSSAAPANCSTCDAPIEVGAHFCANCGAQLSDRTATVGPSLVGATIAGSFEVLEAIGKGGMGAIYRARQLSLNKEVAVKVLHRHLLADPSLARRFHREARAASRLSQANTIDIIDFGQVEDGTLYMAMELVDGVDLSELLARDYPLSTARICRILGQVCLALDAAHAEGIIHRDLKPENIMIEDRRNDPDFVTVLDFGIAKITNKERESSVSEQWHTVAGIVCGTPEYMAPEQATASPLDARADLYSLGVILYQLLTGRVPYSGDSPIQVVTRHLTEKAIPPRDLVPKVDSGLETLTLKLMAKEKSHRPTTAMHVYRELQRIADGAPSRAPIEGNVSPESSSRSATQMLDIDVLSETQPRLSSDVPREGERRTPWIWIALALGLALAVAGLAWGPTSDSSPSAGRPEQEADRAAPKATTLAAEVPEPSPARSPKLKPRSDADTPPTPGPAVWVPRSPAEVAARRGRLILEFRLAVAPSTLEPSPAPGVAVPSAEAVAESKRPPSESKGAASDAAKTAADRKKRLAEERKKRRADAKRRAEEKERKKAERAERRTAALAKAKSALAGGRTADAIAAYRSAIANGCGGSCYKTLGRLLIKSGAAAEGCKYLQKYLSAMPADTRVKKRTLLAPYKCNLTI